MNQFSRASRILNMSTAISGSNKECILPPNPTPEPIPVATEETLQYEHETPVYTELQTASSSPSVGNCITGDIDLQAASNSSTEQQNEAIVANDNSSEENVNPENASAYKKRRRSLQEQQEHEQNKHQLGKPCNLNCKKRCTIKINEEQRLKFYNTFWQLDRQRRRDFFSRSVDILPIKCKKVNSSSKRDKTLLYKIGDHVVCKTFFLSTFGYTHDNVIVKLLKNNEKFQVNPTVCASPDMRGKRVPVNKFSGDYKNKIIETIESYNSCVSHYRIKHAPNRRYLPPGIYPRTIWRDFNSVQKQSGDRQCAEKFFLSVYHSMNISTCIASSDKCTICNEHDMKHPNNNCNE